MAMAHSDAAAVAVYEFVQSDTFPANTSVVSSSLSSPALISLERLLNKARSDLRASIRELSALSAPDIDGWIAQAKQVTSDRDNSLTEANAIIQLHEDAKHLQAKEEDTRKHVNLLQGEVEFSEGLLGALDMIKKTKESVNEGWRLLDQGYLVGAVRKMKTAKSTLESQQLDTLRGTTAFELLTERVNDQTGKITEEANKVWDELIVLNNGDSIAIKKGSGEKSLENVTAVLHDLDLLGPKIIALERCLEDKILRKRFENSSVTQQTITVTNSTISLASTSKRSSIPDKFSEIIELAEFLKAELPTRVHLDLTVLIAPRIQNYIMVKILPNAVPLSVDSLPAFQKTLGQVSQLAESLNALDWRETNRLNAWVDNAPQVWLQTRSSDSLNSLRQMLRRGLGNPRSVEKVETQTIVEGDGLLADEEDGDAWNEEWDKEENNAEPSETEESQKPVLSATVGEDEDTNGWDWDGDEDNKEEKLNEETPATTESEDDDAADAWDAWDEDKAGSPLEEELKLAQEKAQSNGKPKKRKLIERIMTLRESYHITALPEQILEVLIMLVEDADTLSSSRDTNNPIVHTAPSLFALPGTLLAMFRAAAPVAYGMNGSGNMYLYNDSQYLAEQLRSFSEHHASRFPGQDPLVLQPDISALEIFGKRAYSREMESQRTILSDLLDGAQGFSNCTEEPHASQCDLAVMSAIDRVREAYALWRDVLSPSALLQATGSLLSTVVGKIIIEIEELSDIGEAESQRLTGFCTSISSLEDIFMPEASESMTGEELENRVPSTAVYVPNWLKFQYLSNILESNLADIKYLWTEGGLALEYSPDEVTDLIEALFADSTRRKEVINEIRRS